MSDTLTARLDPWHLCDQRKVIAGSADLATFPRLAAETSGGGEVRYDLAFGRDDEGRAIVTGSVSATVSLVCQRCLETLPMTLGGPVTLGVVGGLEEMARLPDDLEPLLVTDGVVVPAGLIEDELLLTLPDVPRHDGPCGPQDLLQPAPASADAAADNPFAVLAGLRDAPGDDG